MTYSQQLEALEYDYDSRYYWQEYYECSPAFYLQESLIAEENAKEEWEAMTPEERAAVEAELAKSKAAYEKRLADFADSPF